MRPIYLNSYAENDLNINKFENQLFDLLKLHCSNNFKIAHYEINYHWKNLTVQSVKFILDYIEKWFHLLTLNNNTILDNILKFSYDEFFLTDTEGKVLMVSNASERLYGLKPKDMVGANINDIDAFWPKLTYKVLEQKKNITSLQHTITGKKLVVTANPVQDDHGNIIQIISNTRDLSDILFNDTVNTKKDRHSAISRSKKYYSVDHHDLFCESNGMKEIYATAKRVATYDSNVLLLGESGVGKNVMAKFIHSNSKRKFGSFIEINCGAIPESLLESELFGYEEGAFTGSRKGGKLGLLELADGGTLFLNEIADLPVFLQVKFLRVLENHKIIPLGSNIEKRIDFRLITATNRNIGVLVAQSKFREDLYYRINVIPILIPPLRERPEDIIDLTKYFVKKISNKYELTKELSEKAYEILKSYSWPGNVRELENIIERVFLINPSALITDEHISHIFQSYNNQPDSNRVEFTPNYLQVGSRLTDIMEDLEKRTYKNALSKYGTTRKIAKALGISQATVVRKIRYYSLK